VGDIFGSAKAPQSLLWKLYVAVFLELQHTYAAEAGATAAAMDAGSPISCVARSSAQRAINPDQRTPATA